MRKTIRKVTMVVAVLITSCQVSLNPKIGPVKAQITMVKRAIPNASGWPAARALFRANVWKRLECLRGVNVVEFLLSDFFIANVPLGRSRRLAIGLALTIGTLLDRAGKIPACRICW